MRIQEYNSQKAEAAARRPREVLGYHRRMSAGQQRGWSVRSIVGLCVLVFAQSFTIGAYPAIVPDMARAVGLTDWQLGTVAGMLGFSRLVAALPIGLVIGRHLRLAVTTAPFLLVAAVLSLASGWSFAVLALARLAMGLAHALVMIGGLTAVLRYHPSATVGAALNAFEFSAMLGMLGGVTVTGLLPATLAWNRVYLMACSPLLLALAVLPFLRRVLPAADEPVARRSGRVSTTAVGGARAGVTPILVMAFATGSALSTTYSTLEQFTVPLRATGEFGLARAGVARLFMTMQLCDIALLLPMALIVDRFPKSRVLGVVALVLATGTVLLAFGDLTLMHVGAVVTGMGMAGWMLPLGVLREETPRERIPFRTALYRVGVDGGIFLGPFLSGLIGRGHLGVLPTLTASALSIIGIRLLLAGPCRAGQPVRPLVLTGGSSSEQP